MEHLTQEKLAALLRDPRGQAELVSHLTTDCEICEAFLAEHDSGLLDGLTDASLLAALDTHSATLDQVGWQRLKRGLKRPSPLRWLAVPLAAAAALAVVALLPRGVVRPDQEQGVKGGQVPVLQLELTAALKSGDGTVARIDDGATVKPDGVLVFRYHLNAAAAATVWLQRQGAAPTRLGEVHLDSGTHELSSNGALLGVSLEGEVGPVSIWVVAGRGSGEPLERVVGLNRVESQPGAAVGRVTVQVQP